MPTTPECTHPECVWEVGAELGEGPVWSAAEQAVWFVDIKGSRIHRLETLTGEKRSWDAPAKPGFLGPVAGGGWVVGTKGALHRFDPATGGFILLRTIEPDLPGNRLNDGYVDAHGRLWFGSMDDGETEASGRLYRLADGALAPMDDGYIITNGPAVSPDGRTLYHTDTLGKLIYAFDLADDGGLSGKRIFAAVEAGYPDGPIVDVEGCVWSGLFGGWGLNRYAPTGELLEHVRLPCANVTKAAFGGPELKTLYVTTAWKGLSEAQRADQPLAGGLFRLTVDVPGQPQAEVRL